MDFIPTPQFLADQMIEAVIGHDVKVIADFAVGDGRLLDAGQAKYPDALCVATDVRQSAVKKLRSSRPNWVVGKCDFLNTRSRSACLALRDLLSTVDLILLNPPFSSRGGSVQSCRLGETDISCSKGLAFVVQALNYLSSDGELVAVLPAGSIWNDKDRDAWRIVERNHAVALIQSNGTGTFTSHNPQTVIVRIARCGGGKCNGWSSITDIEVDQPAPGEKRLLGASIRVIRGRIQMHCWQELASQEGGVALIHSTDLQSNSLYLSARFVKEQVATRVGPGILISRVGAPSATKVVPLPGKCRLALSDCVIALRCQSLIEMEDVRRVMKENWSAFAEMYQGTGAPHITRSRIVAFFRSHGAKIGW